MLRDEPRVSIVHFGVCSNLGLSVKGTYRSCVSLSRIMGFHNVKRASTRALDTPSLKGLHEKVNDVLTSCIAMDLLTTKGSMRLQQLIREWQIGHAHTGEKSNIGRSREFRTFVLDSLTQDKSCQVIWTTRPSLCLYTGPRPQLGWTFCLRSNGQTDESSQILLVSHRLLYGNWQTDSTSGCELARDVGDSQSMWCDAILPFEVPPHLVSVLCFRLGRTVLL